MPSSSRSTAARGPLIFALVLAVGVIAAVAAFLLRSGGEDSIVLPNSQPYTEGVVGTWQRVNPLFAAGNGVDEDLVALVFSGLVRLGSDGSVAPDLAGLPEISEGGRTYTFRLRDDIRWHDGARLTSTDVVFTIGLVQDPAFRGDTSLVSAWSGVEVQAPDTATVVLRLPEASAPFLARHATLPILPEHLLRTYTGATLRDAPFNAQPVGSGPYRLVSITGEEARLEAHADYHLGRPLLDSLRLRFFTDYTAASRAFAANEVDALAYRSVPTSAELVDLSAVEGATVETALRSAYLVLYLNNDVALFQDARVRQAISMAIDRSGLTELAYGTAGVESSLPVAPGSWAYSAAEDGVEADSDASAKLLDEAGWALNPATGIRTHLGAELRITIRTDSDPGRVAVAGAIARQLDPLGIKATIASTSFAVLRRDFLEDRAFQAALVVWDQGPDPDPYFSWHSSQMGTAGLNLANFSDPIADRLIEEGRRNPDQAVRLDMYRQFQEIWGRTSPSPIIAYETFTFAHNGDIEVVLPALMSTATSRYLFVHEWRRR